MSSKWTHSICQKCWNEKNPDREPVHLKEEFASQEACCFCGESTSAGIYVRFDPLQLRCKGIHRDD